MLPSSCWLRVQRWIPKAWMTTRPCMMLPTMGTIRWVSCLTSTSFCSSCLSVLVVLQMRSYIFISYQSYLLWPAQLSHPGSALGWLLTVPTISTVCIMCDRALLWPCRCSWILVGDHHTNRKQGFLGIVPGPCPCLCGPSKLGKALTNVMLRGTASPTTVNIPLHRFPWEN